MFLLDTILNELLKIFKENDIGSYEDEEFVNLLV